ncbi:hypothetical protein ACQZV8_18445, partial [Magnetococcales bacterium HHB-1]
GEKNSIPFMTGGMINKSVKERTAFVYLFATAGMRDVASEDQEVANNLMTALQKEMQRWWDQGSTPTTQVKKTNLAAKIIPGEQEGVFDWISVNYLKGSYQAQKVCAAHAKKSGNNTTSAFHAKKANYYNKTYGVLDLGGSSAQIAFIPNKKEATYPYQHKRMVKLFGKKYPLYVFSYPLQGQNRALAATLDQVTDHTLTGNGCLTSDYVYRKHDHMESYLKARIKKLTHTSRPMKGDFDRCSENIKAAYFYGGTKANCAWLKKTGYSCMGISQPPISEKTRFLAISNYYHVAKSVNPVDDQLPKERFYDTSGLAVNPQQIIKGGRKICQGPWQPDDNPYQWISCFSAAYINVLVHDAFGFSKDSPPITALDTVERLVTLPHATEKTAQTFDASWTIGAASCFIDQPIKDMENKFSNKCFKLD